MKETFIVDKPKRIDKLLAERFIAHSRNYFQYLIEMGCITCNGRKIKKREIPAVGDEIQIVFVDLPEIDLKPEEIPLEILYEDEAIICINKPAGMVVHPAPGHHSGTFVNALLYYCKSLPMEENRPGIVHRLDKETSGVLLAAKTLETHKKLIEAFSNRHIHKEYLAIVVGNPANQTIEAPIGRHPIKRKEMAISETGRSATTHIELLTSTKGFSLIKATPITGRTHQIRVHLRHIKAPILGDLVYGPSKLSEKLGAKRQLLHAHFLRFSHPITKKIMTITAPIPDDLQKWIDELSKI